jgi:hypothetical protein
MGAIMDVTLHNIYRSTKQQHDLNDNVILLTVHLSQTYVLLLLLVQDGLYTVSWFDME